MLISIFTRQEEHIIVYNEIFNTSKSYVVKN